MSFWAWVFVALALPLAAALAASVSLLDSSRYGQLELSELPGVLWVLLAGQPYRDRLAVALVRRDEYSPARVRDLEVKCGIVPPSALEVRWNEFGRQMSAGMANFRAPLTGHSPGRPEHCWMCADRYWTQELGRVRRAENEGPR